MAKKYDDLADRAERGELKVKPGTVRRGVAAGVEAQEALMAATGAANAEDAVHLSMGRPRVGSQKSGASPTLRARVPQALKDRVREVAEAEDRDESDVVRAAVAAYVQQRGAVAYDKPVRS